MIPAKYEPYLLYFERSVLAQYRASPHLYSLKEDDIGGELKTSSDEVSLDENLPDHSLFRLRFGFRRRSNNCICVAALRYKVMGLPEKDLFIWRANMLDNPNFAQNDLAFERWINRYLEGSWEVEDGPRIKIERQIRLIQALTRQTLGAPLFRFEENSLINYPIAENRDAYAAAHLELFRLLIDGLNKDSLEALAHQLKATLTDSSHTINSLKEILPENLIDTIHKPLKKCSVIRNEKHGISSKSLRSFPAFDAFHEDLMAIALALIELNEWLDKELCADSRTCLSKEELEMSFPKIVNPPQPESKMDDLRNAEGKTIHSVEFGEEESHKNAHSGELIIIHFTDGTSMAIQTGSNAFILANKFKGLNPEDFQTDLVILWA
jgi:hypothetical protein